jgi:ribonuclease P protein component
MPNKAGDYVFVAKKGILKVNFSELEKEFKKAIYK